MEITVLTKIFKNLALNDRCLFKSIYLVIYGNVNHYKHTDITKIIVKTIDYYIINKNNLETFFKSDDGRIMISNSLLFINLLDFFKLHGYSNDLEVKDISLVIRKSKIDKFLNFLFLYKKIEIPKKISDLNANKLTTIQHYLINDIYNGIKDGCISDNKSIFKIPENLKSFVRPYNVKSKISQKCFNALYNIKFNEIKDIMKFEEFVNIKNLHFPTFNQYSRLLNNFEYQHNKIKCNINSKIFNIHKKYIDFVHLIYRYNMLQPLTNNIDLGFLSTYDSYSLIIIQHNEIIGQIMPLCKII
jgi:hypothetical protein